MDGEEKTSDVANVQRHRRRSRGSQSNLFCSYKPNYNPEKYADMSPTSVSGTVDSSVTEGFSAGQKRNLLSQRPSANQSSYFSDANFSVLQTNIQDSSLAKRSTNNVADLQNGRSMSNRCMAAEKQDIVSEEDLRISATVGSSGINLRNHSDFPKDSIDGMSLTVNGWTLPSSEPGAADALLLSPDSERSQATSASLMSTSIESSNSISHGSASLTLLLRQPSESVLAQQYFPVTFGATLNPPADSKDPLCHVQPTLTLSKKLARSRSAGHRRHHRPGSGHSSSSSNSKSSIDRIYLMTSDMPGMSTVLSSTPYQAQLARLHKEQLEIEEERLRHLKIQEEVERERGPRPNWYEMRSPQFHYEARKHNEQLKGSDVRLKSTRHK